MPYSLRIILIGIAFITAFSQTAAQSAEYIKSIKPAKCLLLGQWQLVQTLAEGKIHEVKKEAYNCIITFKPHHQYREEVFYESNHWIIEGTWKLNPQAATLALTNRHYISGILEKMPEDIILHLSEFTARQFTGNSIAKGQPVSLYYRKLPLD